MVAVLWKPLYVTSIVMFILSLLLFPFSVKWSVIVILALVTLWSRVPGFVHYLFNQITMHDFFGYIIAGTVGIPVAILFTVFGLWGARIFGPEEWTPYTFRATISGIVAILFVPVIVKSFGGLTIMGFIWFQIITYVVYYFLILMFYREEIMIEIMCFPGAIFFDFIFTVEIFGIFGGAVAGMMVSGIESGWPFVILAGIIIMFIFISKNAGKWGRYLISKIKVIIPDKKVSKKDREEDRRELKKYDRFLEDSSNVNKELIDIFE